MYLEELKTYLNEVFLNKESLSMEEIMKKIEDYFFTSNIQSQKLNNNQPKKNINNNRRKCNNKRNNIPIKAKRVEQPAQIIPNSFLKNYPGRKVVSFCIWGKTKLYHYGLWENAILLPKLYPGWEMVVYYTQTADLEVLNHLKNLPYVTLNKINVENGSQNAMLRFLAGFDTQYDVVISRDADSRLLQRDAEAVKEWLKSDKNFHIMRDHPANRSLIMAGMWGVRNKILCKPEIIEQFWKYIKNPEYKKWGNEQKYLNKYIYPLVKNTSMVHSNFFRPEPFARPFPRTSNPRNKGFVGMTTSYFPNAKGQFKIPDGFRAFKKRDLN